MRNLAVTAAAALFLAFVGAFGIPGSFLRRLAFWLPGMILAGIVGSTLTYALSLIPALRRNLWLFVAAAVIAMTPPATVLIWVYWCWSYAQPLDGRMLVNIAPGVFVVSLAITAIHVILNRAGPATHAPPAGAEPKPVRFLDRLPPKLRGADLYAVEAEDHYLRLHTSRGSDLILFRLADAIAELDGLEGAQVHRSWWIARDGVEDIVRDNGRVSLKLKSGALAPVSRPNVRALKDAGWF
ncbi:MAG: LytTR family transcriptional regulator DNA-binding domain-containing protein [Hyphomonadaceae bacterium]|nr:LytTR family transcriptional regulator DNA-binding domain-containing protein [Hyphomonadaceae bacterium]